MLRSLAEALEAGQLFSARPAAHQPADTDFGVPPAHPAPALRHPSLRDAPGHVANNHGTCLLLRSPPRELQTNPESTSPPLPGAGLGQRAQLPGSTALRCPAEGGKTMRGWEARGPPGPAGFLAGQKHIQEPGRSTSSSSPGARRAGGSRHAGSAGLLLQPARRQPDSKRVEILVRKWVLLLGCCFCCCCFPPPGSERGGMSHLPAFLNERSEALLGKIKKKKRRQTKTRLLF